MAADGRSDDWVWRHNRQTGKQRTPWLTSGTGFHPTDVSCPSGVEAKVGREFDCRFTGAEGKPYTAHMHITKADGERVDFDVKSPPS